MVMLGKKAKGVILLSKIVAVGTAVPPYAISQSNAKAFAEELFGSSNPLVERLMPIFEHTSIERRFISCSQSWFYEQHSFSERNKIYIEMACSLAKEAIERCLQKSDITVGEIEHLIFVSSTGIATPSIDAHLINQLGLSSHVKRTPIWGLGCAGGVAGLARAFEYAKAFPSSRVLFVAVELCSLTFRPQDLSKSNFVATALFADGAAAVLVTGDEVVTSMGAPTIVDSMSTIWPDSLDVMGWEVVEDGLQVVFSRDIPTIVQQQVKPVVDEFLGKQNISIDQITYMVSHPGGKKVLEAYASALALSKEHFHFAYEVLRQYGNMSSVTVLFVLEQVMRQSPRSAYGLMTALGPGFSSEALLLKWS
jgi:alkylresorcinol/alkylpyrone synthase